MWRLAKSSASARASPVSPAVILSLITLSKFESCIILRTVTISLRTIPSRENRAFASPIASQVRSIIPLTWNFCSETGTNVGPEMYSGTKSGRVLSGKSSIDSSSDLTVTLPLASLKRTLLRRSSLIFPSALEKVFRTAAYAFSA